MIDLSRTEPTTIFVVLHRFSGSIIDSSVFASKEEAEAWIEAAFENDPALDYKDSFYIREVVVDESHGPDAGRHP